MHREKPTRLPLAARGASVQICHLQTHIRNYAYFYNKRYLFAVIVIMFCIFFSRWNLWIELHVEVPKLF